MKTFILLRFVLLSFILLSFTQTVGAIGLKTADFGGRIILTKTPPVICNSQYGIVTILPASGSKSLPFVITTTDKTVNPGGQILGQYDKRGDMKTCYIQAGPYRVPVPSYKIKTNKFNTSRY